MLRRKFIELDTSIRNKERSQIIDLSFPFMKREEQIKPKVREEIMNRKQWIRKQKSIRKKLMESNTFVRSIKSMNLARLMKERRLPLFRDIIICRKSYKIYKKKSY